MTLKHSGRVFLAQFSPDGRRIITTSGGHGSARVWDAQNGRELPAVKTTNEDDPPEFSPLSLDGRLKVTVSAEPRRCGMRGTGSRCPGIYNTRVG